ncbi:MAG TPA: hypothetical protein PK255_01700 [Candidatus Pacearchaeota archaeon]|nr:hypothetical protein [Candidatus Pacearchaeota archaeon]HOU79345.1 hypothetical protein [Candidatus Pacearchaeota archaeon]HPJ86875.1 hypothetical protein [Candidatus Pacearchaeota archaeon]HQF82860.1 hypothetical protein [Candidatus Pacearchaeota archaeon]HQJ57774.1 hypothetical protein [Candidatus Pacearchaeota archaeon]
MSVKKRRFNIWITLSILFIIFIVLILIIRLTEKNYTTDDISSECLSIEITNVVDKGENNYEVELITKEKIKNKNFGGVALVFTNSTSILNDMKYVDTYYISNREYSLIKLMNEVTIPVSISNLYNVSTIYVIPYFFDDSGNIIHCLFANQYVI